MSGFTGLVIIFSIIGQVYDIDLKINSIIQRKMALQKAAETVGIYNSRAIAAAPGSSVIFRPINFSGHYNGGYVTPAVRRWVNPRVGSVPTQNGIPQPCMLNQNILNPDGTINKAAAAIPGSSVDILYDNIEAGNCYAFTVYQAPNPNGSFNATVAAPGTAPAHANGRPLNDGELWMKKEEAEALYKVYLQKISAMEKELDMELEALRSKRQALVSQRDEFQKYVAEGIKMTFKNAYA